MAVRTKYKKAVKCGSRLGMAAVAGPLYILGFPPELRHEIPRVPGLHYGTVPYTLLNTLVLYKRKNRTLRLDL